jgi:hypothetical protein
MKFGKVILLIGLGLFALLWLSPGPAPYRIDAIKAVAARTQIDNFLAALGT